MTMWAGEGKNWVQEITKNPSKKDEVIVALLRMTRPPTTHLLKKVTGVPCRKPSELDPVVLEVPGRGEGIEVEIRGGSKMVVGGINGKRSAGAVGDIHRQLQEWWRKAANLRRRENDWAIHIIREHNKAADAWAEKKERRVK